jgi:hypothetical protein
MVINNFPINIKTSPNPTTRPKSAGFLKIKKNPSLAAEQKFFPVIAIWI